MLDWKSYIGNVFLRPIILVTVFSILGRLVIGTEKSQALALGIAVHAMIYVLMSGISSIYRTERENGSLPFLYISRVNRVVNFFSRLVLHYPNGIFAFISGAVTGWLIVGIEPAAVNWGGFILAFLSINTAVMAYSQLVGMFGIMSRSLVPLNGLFIGILALITGIIIPVTALPAPVQAFAGFLPITNGLFALRQAFTGAPLSEIAGSIGCEFLLGLGYFAVAVAGFLLIERWTKRTGGMTDQGA
jgi:ABC-2 type transport system permease protein